MKQKDSRISDLEKKNKEIYRENQVYFLKSENNFILNFKEKLNQEIKEKQIIIMKNEKERNEYNDLLEKYQALVSQKSNEDFSNNQTSDMKNLRLKSNYDLSSKQNMDSKRKLPKINAYEVEMIGTEIKYGLQLKRIAFEEIEQVRNIFCK